MLIKCERRQRQRRRARRSVLLKLVCSVLLLSFPFVFVREAHAWSFFNTKKDDSNSAELGERIETQFDRFPEEVSSSKSTTTKNNNEDDLNEDGEDDERMNAKERRKQERREKKRLKKLERKEE